MKPVLTLVFIFFTAYLSGQSFTLVEGKEFEATKKNKGLDHFYSDNDHYYLVRNDEETNMPSICKFSYKNSELVYQIKIELRENERFSGAFVKNGKILVFSVQREADESRRHVVRRFHTETGSGAGPEKLLEKVPPPPDKKRMWLLYIEFSPDGKKLMTLLKLWSDFNQPDTLKTAKLYDTETLDKIWEKEPVKQFESSAVFASNFFTDNAGRLIYQITYPGPGTDSNPLHGICVSQPGSKTTDCVKIPSEGITTADVRLEQVETELVCTGEFLKGINTEKSKATLETTGFFLVTIDAEKAKIKSESFDLFEPNIASKLTYKFKNQCYQLNDIKDNNKMFMHHKVYMVDHELFLVKYHGFHMNHGTIGGAKNPGTKICNEVIVRKYNTDGKLFWTTVIPRSTYSAYGADALEGMACNGKLYLFYYDLEANLKKFPDPMVYDPKEYKPVSMLPVFALEVCLSIDKDREITRERLMTPENKRIDIWWGDAHNKNTVLVVPRFIDKSFLRIDMIKLK